MGKRDDLFKRVRGSCKGWFPYDSRRSQTIADRRRLQRDLFPYNRRRSQTIAEPAAAIHFGQQKCQMNTRFVLASNLSKQHGGHRGGNFAASKFTSSFKAGFHMIADDRESQIVSQKVLRSSAIIWKSTSAIVCDRLRSHRRRSQTIAEVGFHMIADDLRFAIVCDRMETSLKQWK